MVGEDGLFRGKAMNRRGQIAQVNPKTTLTEALRADWHDPLFIGASMIGELGLQHSTHQHVLNVLDKLAPDDFLEYTRDFYRVALSSLGENWRYCDLASAIVASAQLIRPEVYCEIGVRRGRSLALLSSVCPDAHVIGFDLWEGDYAGMPNPGPDFVRNELLNLNHRGPIDLIRGNSHKTLSKLLNDDPQLYFDLAVVDGDHTAKGALRDLKDILPRIKRGGVLIFDDIAHSATPWLSRIWRQLAVQSRRYSTWEYTEVGFGVGILVRKDG